MNDTARDDIEAEVLELEREISRLRLTREKATYKLERWLSMGSRGGGVRSSCLNA